MNTVETEKPETILRQQESLRAVIESISRELELQPLLTSIVRYACELIGADNGTIGLVDEDRMVGRTEAVFQMPASELGAEITPGVGLAGRVLLTRETVVLGRYGEVDHPTQPDLVENAVVGLPIFWHGKMTGFFGIGARPPRRFDERSVEVLTQFARHAAIAIENARRYAREQRRTERFALIARMGSIITTNLRLEDLVQNTADAIHELLGYPNVAIPLIEATDPDLMVLRHFGGQYKQFMRGEYRLPTSGGLMGAAARERKTILVNDVSSDPRHMPTPGAVGIIAELVVPILLSDQIFGVVNVESDTPFSQEDANILRIVADQLAVAIENARLFKGKQKLLEETQLLYQTSKRLGTATDVDEVVHAYLEQVATRGHFDCTVLLHDTNKEGKRTVTTVQGKWTARKGIESKGQSFPFVYSGIDTVLDSGQTTTIRDRTTDRRLATEFHTVTDGLGGPSLAIIPLLVRGERIGVVVLSAPEPYSWQEEDLQRYQATATQLATAVDSRRQQVLVYDQGQQVAVLEERQRLARELHDSVTQLIFSMTLVAQTLGSAWQRDPSEGERRVQRLIELSQSALAEMRDLLQELRPVAGTPTPVSSPGTLTINRVRHNGLPAALAAQASDASRDGRTVVAETDGYEKLPIEQEEALFRITQEALSNAARHSQAGTVRVRLRTRGQATQLTITDDGIGFPADLTAAKPPRHDGGMGLTTMRERAEAFGGTLRLSSEPGAGTRVEVILPTIKQEGTYP
ncbi:MAG: GAF domain-containing protein [Akkermansiaceae bacterium]|nr:GAF domain-containing protein [Armatimonadota bacterium]